MMVPQLRPLMMALTGTERGFCMESLSPIFVGPVITSLVMSAPFVGFGGVRTPLSSDCGRSPFSPRGRYFGRAGSCSVVRLPSCAQASARAWACLAGVGFLLFDEVKRMNRNGLNVAAERATPNEMRVCERQEGRK